MRLSTALMLGVNTCKLKPIRINSCAFGAALNAEGVPREKWYEIGSRYKEIARLWPWTNGEEGMVKPAREIYKKFDRQVCTGEMTLEELHDYIKSVEPDCDCNRFNCDCKQKVELVANQTEEVASL